MRVLYNYQIDGRQLGDNEIIKRILESRKINDFDRFFRPPPENLIPLSKLKNIDKAYDMICEAKQLGYRVLIVADNDVDGVTSSAIMYRYLRQIMPHRQISYTIQSGKVHGIENFDVPDGNAGLLIIVDSINEESDYTKFVRAGWRVLCLDHHMVPDSVLNDSENLGDDFVLVSSANDYPNPQLSGAGVCLKFCMYIDYNLLTYYANDMYDLAACGIVADVSSMLSPENRYIVSNGLNNVNNYGIKKIIGSYEFNTSAIAFSIAPLVNACVRMENNDIAAKIFAEDDVDVVDECVKKGKKLKDEQVNIISKLMPDIERQIDEQQNDRTIIVEIDKQYKNLTGVIANRILGNMQRPVIVYHKSDDGSCAGSMRAVGVDDFTKYVNKYEYASCKGHELSAGFKCAPNKITVLKANLEQDLQDIEQTKTLMCDILLNPNQITADLIRNIKIINRVSGKDFEPVNIMVRSDNFVVSCFKGGQHLKVIDETGVLYIKWNDDTYEKWDCAKHIVCVGTPDVAYYGKQKYIQLILDYYEFSF